MVSTHAYGMITVYRHLILIPAIAANLCAATIIPANDPNISFTGRFDFADPRAPRFNWSGSAIEAAFEGASIAMALSDGWADYDVAIDGAFHHILVTQNTPYQTVLATGLASGAHTVRVTMRSENHWSAAVFSGFVLDDGKKLLPLPAKPDRRIEFIGDSYTVGYGNESQSRACDAGRLRSTTNTNAAFGAIVSRAFAADGCILGWSGKGMVRNYGEPTQTSATPFPCYYDSTLGAAGPKWNYSQWVPQVVVICLGTNDFSTTPNPSQQLFVQAYHAFINRIFAQYPMAMALCVATQTGPCTTYVHTMVNEEKSIPAHSGKVHYAAFPASLDMTGCDSHPSLKDHQAIAAVLGDCWRATENRLSNQPVYESCTVETEQRYAYSAAPITNSAAYHRNVRCEGHHGVPDDIAGRGAGLEAWTISRPLPGAGR
jgi:lysophospholipase L1-like esterase